MIHGLQSSLDIIQVIKAKEDDTVHVAHFVNESKAFGILMGKS